MTVEPHERARFLVTSHGDTFLCDTLTNRGNGSCGCLHFTRLQGQIDEAVKNRTFKRGRQYMCPHLEAAHWALHWQFVDELRKQFPDNTTDL
jgi:hypothetical protein